MTHHTLDEIFTHIRDIRTALEEVDEKTQFDGEAHAVRKALKSLRRLSDDLYRFDFTRSVSNVDMKFLVVTDQWCNFPGNEIVALLKLEVKRENEEDKTQWRVYLAGMDDDELDFYFPDQQSARSYWDSLVDGGCKMMFKLLAAHCGGTQV